MRIARSTRKTLAEFNVRNPEMGGLVGNRLNKNGHPFGFAEEFVEVYRLHSLLPETIDIRRIANQEQVEKIPFVETRQAGSPKLTEKAVCLTFLTPLADSFRGNRC